MQPAFLRRLDSEDLVSPERSDGGQRRYTRSEIDQIHRVSELAGEGLTLAGIRRLLALEAEVAQLKREVARLRAAQAPARPGEPTQTEEETLLYFWSGCHHRPLKSGEPVGSLPASRWKASAPWAGHVLRR